MGRIYKATDTSAPYDFTPPFYIIKDHRRMLKLRRQRDARKKKIHIEREMMLSAAREEKQNRIRQINMKMLETDEVWNMVNDDMKVEESEQSFTHDGQTGINKRIQQLRLEVLFAFNHLEKAPIFAPSFAPFEFMHC